jgi:hypothetical protein
MILAGCPPTLSLPRAGGEKSLSCTAAPFCPKAFLPPSWGRDGVGGLA